MFCDTAARLPAELSLRRKAYYTLRDKPCQMKGPAACPWLSQETKLNCSHLSIGICLSPLFLLFVFAFSSLSLPNGGWKLKKMKINWEMKGTETRKGSLDGNNVFGGYVWVTSMHICLLSNSMSAITSVTYAVLGLMLICRRRCLGK